MKSLLCCILKLENRYLEEWVTHYKKLGFDHIHIYDNNDATGMYAERIESLPLIAENIANGYISVTKIPGVTCAQVQSYNECYKNFSAEYDWIAFFDIDEFLVLEDGGTINSFLAQEQFKKFQMIHINWKVYDDNGIMFVKDDNYNLMDRFTHPCGVRGVNVEIKSIVRTKIPGLAFTKNPHTMNSKPIRCCDPTGNSADYKSQKNVRVVHKGAWLNHYICKSVEEYCMNKLLRLGGHTPHAASLRYTMEFYFRYNIKTREKVDAYNNCVKARLSGGSLKTTPPIKINCGGLIRTVSNPAGTIPVCRKTVRASAPSYLTSGRIRKGIHL